MKTAAGLFKSLEIPLLTALGLTAFVLGGVSLFELSPFAKPPLVATVVPQTVISLTNQDRVANGVPPLRESLLLDQAAQAKADDEAARGYFSHTTPEGNSPLYFISQAGYHYQNAGENLGLNYPDAQALETGWMDSTEHRANVLRSVFTEAGVGAAQGMYEGYEATFAVEMFATPLPGYANTAVAPSPVATTSVDANAQYTASLEALISSLTKKIAELRAQLGTSSK